MKGIISFSIDKGLLDTIDSIRKDVPRSRFILRLLEFALGQMNTTDKKREKMIPVDNSFDVKDQQVSIVRGEN